MIKTDLKINTNHVIAFAALSAVIYGVYRAKQGIAENINKINPASPDNIVNKGVQSVVGERRLQSGFDKVFAVADLINPFNESDRFALEVLGFKKSGEP